MNGGTIEHLSDDQLSLEHRALLTHRADLWSRVVVSSVTVESARGRHTKTTSSFLGRKKRAFLGLSFLTSHLNNTRSGHKYSCEGQALFFSLHSSL